MKMDLNVYIQLIFMCVVSTIFAFSGIVSNTLVIVSFWISSQLRKKLCHFIIMVLSCFDLVAVATNNLGILVFLISWLREDYNLLPFSIYLEAVAVFLGFSFHALFVMSIERYLGAYYPVLHRTSVTRRRLLIRLAILLSFQTILNVICVNDMIISMPLVLLVFLVAVFPPLVYLNFKLFKISSEMGRRKATLSEEKTALNLKSISACLLAVACLVVLSVPSSVYIVFTINTENKQISNARIFCIWVVAIFTVNGTLNSLIFFWKNKVFRTQGIEVLKTMKNRLVEYLSSNYTLIYYVSQ